MGKMKIIGKFKETGKGKLCILDTSGHAEVAWDLNDPASVAAAEKQFNELIAIPGMNAHEVTESESGEKSEKIDKFNPTAGKIIMYPRLAGG